MLTRKGIEDEMDRAADVFVERVVLPAPAPRPRRFPYTDPVEAMRRPVPATAQEWRTR